MHANVCLFVGVLEVMLMYTVRFSSDDNNFRVKCNNENSYTFHKWFAIGDTTHKWSSQWQSQPTVMSCQLQYAKWNRCIIASEKKHLKKQKQHKKHQGGKKCSSNSELYKPKNPTNTVMRNAHKHYALWMQSAEHKTPNMWGACLLAICMAVYFRVEWCS